MIDLDDKDKLIIIIVCILFLLIVLISLVCVLNPKCLLYPYCPFQHDRPNNPTWGEAPPAYGSIPKSPQDLKPSKTPSGGKSQHSGLWPQMVPLRESEYSDWSDISVPEIIELRQDPSGRKRKSSRTSDYSSSASSVASPVHFESRLAYSVKFDRMTSKLHIRIIQLGNFRVTAPESPTAPYVKVRVYKTPKHFFTFKTKTARDLVPNNLEAEVQTKIQRRTDNPVFNEGFEVKVEESELSAITIKFLVCDFDKFSRHVVIGEVTRDLSKFPVNVNEETLFNDQLIGHTEENLGELHVALMYLPTAEKLSVMVLNAKGLRSFEGPKRNIETYVKIMMMYDGRPLKKTKTSSKSNDLNPVFNETFVFDVPPYQLDKVYFGITVIGVDKDKEDGRHMLGRLYIGVNFDPTVREQWLEMVNNARKQVACWHKLQS